MITVLLKDGKKITVPFRFVYCYASVTEYENKNISNLSLTKDGISFDYKGHPLILNPSRFSDLGTTLFSEDYSFLEVKGHDVIDIGMNIGDSTIYFAVNGAKRVIGLEPYPFAFSFAERNVKLNNIQNVILLNAGYGKDSKVLVDENKVSRSDSSLIAINNNGKEIPIYSLGTLLNQYEIKDAILKMDCEGCEYNLLDEDEEGLRRFRMIQIEYHYGYQKLKEKLEKCGFTVKCTEPVNFYNSEASNPNMVVGYIYAEIKQQP